MKYIHRTGSSNAIISGKCQKCGDVYEYSVKAKTPDLTDIIDIITPRVDSRQIIVDSVIPIVCHIGGPGETSYYSEVIPAMRTLGLPVPLYLRYTRLFYNTPWNEAYAKRLQSKGYPTLAERELFNALKQWVEARNDDNAIMLKEAHFIIREFIERVFRELNSEVSRLKGNLDEIKSKLKDQENRAALIREMRTKQTQVQEIELYLSSALGMFSPEKFGQEVSWAWIDVAIITGLSDLVGVFLRQYNKNTPNSSMFYANLT